MNRLPPLREELVLSSGPPAQDGSPTWTLLDPVRNRFFRVGWPAFEILSRWDLGGPQDIAAGVEAETTLRLGPEAVEEVLRFAEANLLVRAFGPGLTAHLAAIRKSARVSRGQWLLHNYLFFRVPLLRPDRFLTRLLPWTRWLWSKTVRRLTLAALLAGLWMIGRQWELFAGTLASAWGMEGWLAYGAALAGVKTMHEFAHALTAKRHGCRTPTMGVAFLVMWPVLYTDVTDGWRLPDKRQRLAVGAAGVLAELAVAAWASLAWGLLPDGPARQAAFYLSSVTWASTLVINLSPFMRFDGYYLVMDWLDLPNLHERSSALARWRLREALFGLGEPPPERLPPWTARLLIGFAWLSWIYRLSVFLGIALLVYHFFIKLVGVALFAVEIGWFVALPLIREGRAWWNRRAAIARGPRGWALGALLLALLGLGLAPTHGTVRGAGLLGAREQIRLYAPAAGRLLEMRAAEGRRTAAGEPLFALETPELASRLVRARSRIAVLEYELSSVSYEAGFRDRVQVLRQELATALAEAVGLERELARNVVVAPLSGRLRDLPPDLRPGQWLAAKEPLGTIVDDGRTLIETYVDERDVARLSPGAAATFFADGGVIAPVAARVESVDRHASTQLRELALASTHGGPIPVREQHDQLLPERAIYRVTLTAALPEAASIRLRGQTLIEAERRSPLARLAQSILAVLIRESGL